MSFLIQRAAGRNLTLTSINTAVLRIGRGTNQELRSENPAVALEHAIIENLASRKRARIVSTNGEGTESDSPASMLTRGLLQQIAAYERALISARTRAALRAKIARGERASGVDRFGATDQERAALAILEDCRQAGYSYQATAAELNRQGFTTRSGQPWRWEYVRGIERTRTGTRLTTTPGSRQKATRAALALVTR